MEENFYDMLGISKNATPEEIHKAFQAKSRKEHPDVGGDPDKFRTLSLAKHTLLDPEKREHYDKTGTEKPRKNEVLEHVSRLVEQALCSEKDIRDPVKWMCDQVDRARADVKGSIEQNKRSIKRIKRRMDRFAKANANTENRSSRDFILQHLQSKIAAHERAIEAGEHEVDVATAVLAFFNGLVSPQPESVFEGATRPFAASGWGDMVANRFLEARRGDDE